MLARRVALTTAIGIALIAPPALAETVECPSATYVKTSVAPPAAKPAKKPAQAHRSQKAKRRATRSASAHPVKKRKTAAAKRPARTAAAAAAPQKHASAAPRTYRYEKKITTIACQAAPTLLALPPESIEPRPLPGEPVLAAAPSMFSAAGGYFARTNGWAGGLGGGSGAGGGGGPSGVGNGGGGTALLPPPATPAPVPEPGAWLLMIGGVFGVGAQLRHSRARNRRLRAVVTRDA